MRYQDYICGEIEDSLKQVFKYAAAVPDDKVSWAPLDEGRTVLDICQELAKTPDWAYDIISGKEPDWSDEAMAESKKEMAQWTTVAACEAAAKEKMQRVFELYKSLPDEKLKETKFLPFDGGRDFTFMEMMDYPRWNYCYHLGQIAYIQILYGDKEMH